MPEYRLGDVIDDYCVRCKRIMNHAVVSMMNAEPAKVRCRTCHSEHNGRPFQLVKWPGGRGREGFDHTQTGWALEGGHTKPTCNACHKASLVAEASVRSDASLAVQRTFLGLGTACGACHLDEHRGRVSRQCLDCHTGSIEELDQKIAAWQKERNARQLRVRWTFETASARVKLKRLYKTNEG